MLALQSGDIYETNPLENRQIYGIPLNLWRQFTPKVVVYRQTHTHTHTVCNCVCAFERALCLKTQMDFSG